jgi:hypothetical protein
MDRFLLPESLEIGPERVFAEQFGIADIELIERDRVGVLARFV